MSSDLIQIAYDTTRSQSLIQRVIGTVFQLRQVSFDLRVVGKKGASHNAESLGHYLGIFTVFLGSEVPHHIAAPQRNVDLPILKNRVPQLARQLTNGVRPFAMLFLPTAAAMTATTGQKRRCATCNKGALFEAIQTPQLSADHTGLRRSVDPGKAFAIAYDRRSQPIHQWPIVLLFHEV
ncbi:hypothetical protein EO087_00170 [Dyella sp. M7H15-1]|uniref:hypothetical protein n=1 Tax=Dyella sp. M7H15-1 TaxID=2501295 RepID=UPI001005201A|nr:hypothetical protein [Dyella sp. M7H15-1]QAU22581.1 hypothetical protein EO087_00170 [Dyella sp. M7H15-1]